MKEYITKAKAMALVAFNTLKINHYAQAIAVAFILIILLMLFK